VAITIEGPASFSADPLTLLGDRGSLIVHIAAGAPAGVSAITVHANGSDAIASAQIDLLPRELDSLRLDVQPAAISLASGDSAAVTIGLTRHGAFAAQAIQIHAADLPAGVTADPAAAAPGVTSVVLTLRSAAGTPPAPAQTATIAACADSCVTAPLAVAVVAPFDVGFDAQLGTLVQGGTASAPFTVRRAGTAKAVVVHAGDLPPGVTAPDVTVAAGETAGALSLTAAPDAELGLTPRLVDASGGGFDEELVLGLQVVATAGTPEIFSFDAAANPIFVGDIAQLTAVFEGDSGSIDGIGTVESGVPVGALLTRTTTFVLRVRRGRQEATAQLTVGVNYRDRIRPLRDAPIAQANHLAAEVHDSRVLLMGGNTSETPLVPDSTLTQIFDIATEQFTPGPELPLSAEAGLDTTFAPLAEGAFLLIGTGLNAPIGRGKLVASQVFDPATQRLARVGDTTLQTNTRTATALADGDVLLTGGQGPLLPPSAAAALYLNAEQRWLGAGEMHFGRKGHTATLLRDGRVLIAGGVSCCRDTGVSPVFVTSTAEIYDPGTGQFSDTGSMASARVLHTATLLPDGRVLIAGGDGDESNPAPLTTELYDPATGTFSPAGDLAAARDSHVAVRLADQRVLLVGGKSPSGAALASTAIFDPATGQWSAGPTQAAAFFGATVTLLEDGKVLIFGGEDGGGFPSASAALFE
jgi:hypothetical protein